jgi:hypothetical protein
MKKKEKRRRNRKRVKRKGRKRRKRKDLLWRIRFMPLASSGPVHVLPQPIIQSAGYIFRIIYPGWNSEF